MTRQFFADHMKQNLAGRPQSVSSNLQNNRTTLSAALVSKDCLKKKNKNQNTKKLSIFYRTIKLVAVGNMVYMMYLSYKHLTEHLRKYYRINSLQS